MSGVEDSRKHGVVDGKPGRGDEYLSDDEEPQEGCLKPGAALDVGDPERPACQH